MTTCHLDNKRGRGELGWQARSFLRGPQQEHQTMQNFTFCWPCIMSWVLVNDLRDAQFFTMHLFLFLTLHMFRAHCAHHQERQIVSTRHGHRHRVSVTRGYVDTICLSWWWARHARKMQRVKNKNKNKYIVKNCASRWSFIKNQTMRLPLSVSKFKIIFVT
jgi:hypothetical protein